MPDVTNQNPILDARNLMTGKDGQLYITTSDGTQLFLSEVDTFQAQMNVTTTEVQPVGSAQRFAVETGYTVTLTFTEMVVRDDVLLKPLFDDLAKGIFPRFDFQGKLRRGRDGVEERVNFTDCVLNGNVDLMNLSPGDVIRRQWNFTVNGKPNLQKYITTENMTI